MLKLYDYLEDMMEEHNHQWFYETRLRYFAHDVLEMLEVTDQLEAAYSLNRTFQACKTLGIPLDKNFKRVYRFNGKDLIEDYKISPFACYLLIINCNPSHESVAKAQLYFAMNQMHKK